MKRSLALVAAACGATLLLAACNPAAQRQTQGPATAASAYPTTYEGTLRTSGFNPSDEVGKARAEVAAGKISPAKVEMDTTNFDAQKFAAQAQAGNVPDLIQVDRAALPTLADKGLVRPLESCYQTHGVKPSERYYEAALRDVTYDSKIYGVPQFFQVSLVIGNKRVMDAAGVKPEDLDTSKPERVVEAAKKMYKETGGTPSLVGFDPDVPGSMGTWFAAFGGKVNDDAGKPTLDSPENVRALTFLKQLTDAQGGYAKLKSFKDTMDVFGDKNPYASDQVGAQLWAQWYINVLAKTKDKVTIVGVPLKDRDGHTLGMAGGTALAIPTGAKNPGAACAWALSVTSPEAWQQAGKARHETNVAKGALDTGLFTGSPVADKAVREAYVKPSGNAQFDQVIQTAYGQLDRTVAFAGSPAGAQLTDALKNAAVAAVTGEKTPEQALAEAQATAMRAWDQSNLAKKR